MVSSELVGTALSWMLTYLIHSTILILAVWLLCRGIKPLAAKISPSAENLGWKLALVGAFVTATVQIAVGVRPALGAFEFESGPKVVEQVEREQPRVMVIPAGQPVIVDEREAMMLGAGPGSLSSADPAAPEPEPAPLWPKLVLLAWAIGAVLTSYRLIACAWSLRRRLKDRGPVLEDPVLESFLTLCRDAEINRKIELTQSTRIASPIALWRREIVVPERAVTELPPAAMRSVLAHELAHLERRDPFWLAFAAVIEALCFFQPLNRLARRGMQESAELLCDDWAIARTGDGVTFAKSLAEVASWEQANRSSLLLAGMISGERPLVRRVRRALDGDPKRFEAEDSPRPTRMLVGVGSLAALIMVAPGAVNASPPSADTPSKRELRQQRKAERQADDARRKADEARAAAEAAEREAQRLAEEAGRAAAPAPEAPAGNGSHLIIRDGDEYLIIDENGVRLRSKDADIDIIDGANPKMRMRVREGDQELDLDLDFDAITNMALEMLGEELLGGPMAPMPPMAPSAPMGPGAPMPPSMPGGMPGMMFGPGFDLDEFEAMTEALEQLENIGFDEEALEREIEAIERELQEEL
ncbi:MAG TPA: M56 family metallopeptidase, partial [Enhygromyxa sp.]|nr:M56 family metallopeptidase [Enhygromyxa sp.]